MTLTNVSYVGVGPEKPFLGQSRAHRRFRPRATRGEWLDQLRAPAAECATNDNDGCSRSPASDRPRIVGPQGSQLTHYLPSALTAWRVMS